MIALDAFLMFRTRYAGSLCNRHEQHIPVFRHLQAGLACIAYLTGLAPGKTRNMPAIFPDNHFGGI